MSRQSYTIYLAAIGIGLPLLIVAVVGRGSGNRRGHWWLGSLMIGFALGIHTLILRAHRTEPPHLSTAGLLTVAGAFVVGPGRVGDALAQRPIIGAVFVLSSVGLLQVEEVTWLNVKFAGTTIICLFRSSPPARPIRSTASSARSRGWHRSAITAAARSSVTASRRIGTFYCCAHCARKEGIMAVADHA